MRRAGCYVRSATMPNENSILRQMEAIVRYAAKQDLQLVRLYADEGTSGLRLTDRTGMRHLLRDVEDGAAGLHAILVYDVGRWGGFENPDQAALLEHRCRSAGVYVHYCAEPSAGGEALRPGIAAPLKRIMSVECNREPTETGSTSGRSNSGQP